MCCMTEQEGGRAMVPITLSYFQDKRLFSGFFNKLIATFATAGHITGAALNPARVIGPAAVFNTGWSVVRAHAGTCLHIHPPCA